MNENGSAGDQPSCLDSPAPECSWKGHAPLNIAGNRKLHKITGDSNVCVQNANSLPEHGSLRHGSNWTQASQAPTICTVWILVGIFCLSCPSIWLWGLIAYLRAGHASDWRSRASLVGLFAPIVSILYAQVLLVVVWKTGQNIASPPLERWFFGGGLWIPLTGMFVGSVGRPKLILAIVPVALGTMLFWFFTTLP